MKNIVFFFCVVTLALGCSQNSDDPASDFNPDDIDGDGVTNEIEIVDGTNPEDPCSLNISHIYYPILSQAWKSLDCDGDGVINWDEMDPDGNGTVESNGTSPFWECDVNVSSQTLSPSEYWLNLDCDGDGYSNQQEVSDDTDINNNCSFGPGNQDLIPDLSWMNMDCDNDGRSNGEEIEQNTNPLDPSDFLGSGNILKEIVEIGSGKKHIFSENGNLYDKILSGDDSILTDFEYDAQNNLISVFIGDDDILVSFSYQNNQISQIIKTVGSVQQILNVEYQGNSILLLDENTPQNLFSYKFIFNNEGKLISKEHLYSASSIILSNLKTYNYDANFENLLSTSSINRGYNADTEEYYDLNEIGLLQHQYSSNEQFSVVEGVFNPIFQARQNMYIHSILVPEILEEAFYWDYLGGSNFNFFSSYQTSYNSWTGGGGYSFGFGTNNVQSNGLPSAAYYNQFSSHIDFQFFYE